jgi:hypothetical protein
MTNEPKNVVAFPDMPSRTWREVRPLMRDHLSTFGASDEVLDAVLNVLGEIHADLPSHRIAIKFASHEERDAMQYWVTGNTIVLLTEIAKREIELRQAG